MYQLGSTNYRTYGPHDRPNHIHESRSMLLRHRLLRNNIFLKKLKSHFKENHQFNSPYSPLKIFFVILIVFPLWMVLLSITAYHHQIRVDKSSWGHHPRTSPYILSSMFLVPKLSICSFLHFKELWKWSSRKKTLWRGEHLPDRSSKFVFGP